MTTYYQKRNDVTLIRRNAKNLSTIFASVVSAKYCGAETRYKLGDYTESLDELQAIYQETDAHKLYKANGTGNEYILRLHGNETIYFWTSEPATACNVLLAPAKLKVPAKVESGVVDPTTDPVIEVEVEVEVEVELKEMPQPERKLIDRKDTDRIYEIFGNIVSAEMYCEAFNCIAEVKTVQDFYSNALSAELYQLTETKFKISRPSSSTWFIVTTKKPQESQPALTEPMTDYVVAVYHSYSCPSKTNDEPEYFTLNKWDKTVGRADRSIARKNGCVISWNRTLERVTITAICCNLPSKVTEQMPEIITQPIASAAPETNLIPFPSAKQPEPQPAAQPQSGDGDNFYSQSYQVWVNKLVARGEYARIKSYEEWYLIAVNVM